MYFPTFIQGWETVEILRRAPYGTQYKIRNNAGDFSLLRVTDIPDSIELHQNLSRQGPVAFNYYCQNELSKFENAFRMMCNFSNSPYILKPLQHIIQPFSNYSGFAFFARYEFLPTIDSVYIERTLKNAVKLFRDLCNGLRPLHQNGLLYGNILPSNIFLGNCFKLGEIVPYSPQNSFTPPEVLNGGAIGFHSDIYSVGAVVAWFLTSAFPPHSISMLNGGIGYIVSKACAMNPLYRYHNIDELLSDLNSIFPINDNFSNQNMQEKEEINTPSVQTNATPVNANISIEQNPSSPLKTSQSDNICEAASSAETTLQNNNVADSISSNVDTNLNISTQKSVQNDEFFGATMPINDMFGNTPEKSVQNDEFFGATMPINDMFGNTPEKSVQNDEFFGTTMPINDMFGNTPEKSVQNDEFFGATMPINDMFGNTPEKSVQNDEFFGATMPINDMFGNTPEKSVQNDEFFGATMPINDMFGNTPEKSVQNDEFFGATMPNNDMFGHADKQN